MNVYQGFVVDYDYDDEPYSIGFCTTPTIALKYCLLRVHRDITSNYNDNTENYCGFRKVMNKKVHQRYRKACAAINKLLSKYRLETDDVNNLLKKYTDGHSVNIKKYSFDSKATELIHPWMCELACGYTCPSYAGVFIDMDSAIKGFQQMLQKHDLVIVSNKPHEISTTKYGEFYDHGMMVTHYMFDGEIEDDFDEVYDYGFDKFAIKDKFEN